MKTILEKKRNIPVICEVETLVVGGGTAGVPAAISSARSGKKTLLVEQLGFLGGTATAALVTPLMHSCIPGNPSTPLNREINQRLIDMGGGAKDANENDGWFDPLLLSFLLEEMALEAGVEILYHTFFADVIVKDGMLKGIIVENKGGRGAILAGCVIDATGDADIAFRAGCPVESGHPDTKENQPTSLRFEVCGIDLERFSRFVQSLGQKSETDPAFFHTAMVWEKSWPLEPVFRKAVEDGDLLERDGNYFQAFSIPGKPACLAFNCPEISPERDVTRPAYQSRVLSDGRRAILRLFRFMKKDFPGFEIAFLSRTAVLLGIRETRRIRGEYVLTGRDILSYKKFDDAVARSNYPVDIHGALDAYENVRRPDLPESERFFEIPYRCLVPKGIDNLLVAGRCLSADFVAQSTARIQPTCRALGEAAGIAAALCLDKEIPPRSLDGREVREIMRSRGAFL